MKRKSKFGIVKIPFVLNSRNSWFLFLCFLWLVFSNSLFLECKRSKIGSSVGDLRDSLANYARLAYYWNTDIPASFNPNSYSSKDTFNTEVSALQSFTPLNSLNQHLDRFSFVLTQSDYTTIIKMGSRAGYGMEFRFDSSRIYHIRYVAHASEAFQKGVRRGWAVDSVNGIVPTDTSSFFNQVGNALSMPSVRIAFTDPIGISHNFILSSANVVDDEVVTTKVIDTLGKKIGYMVYNTFLPLGSSSSLHPGLDTAFAGLAKHGITDLVIDLRYNGGGFVQIVTDMLDALVSPSEQGKVLFTETFNTNLQSDNSTALVNTKSSTKPISLNLNSIHFIVSEETASASELIINSLSPYFPGLQLIGVCKGRRVSQRTAGKPFGFFNRPLPFTKPQYQAFLINDETKNSLGKDDYTDGFAPNAQVYDGVDYDWGDLREYGLASAIHYILNGSFPTNTLAISLAFDHKRINANLGFVNDQSYNKGRIVGMFHFPLHLNNSKLSEIP